MAYYDFASPEAVQARQKVWDERMAQPAKAPEAVSQPSGGNDAGSPGIVSEWTAPREPAPDRGAQAGGARRMPVQRSGYDHPAYRNVYPPAGGGMWGQPQRGYPQQGYGGYQQQQAYRSPYYSPQQPRGYGGYSPQPGGARIDYGNMNLGPGIGGSRLPEQPPRTMGPTQTPIVQQPSVPPEQMLQNYWDQYKKQGPPPQLNAGLLGAPTYGRYGSAAEQEQAQRDLSARTQEDIKFLQENPQFNAVQYAQGGAPQEPIYQQPRFRPPMTQSYGVGYRSPYAQPQAYQSPYFSNPFLY